MTPQRAILSTLGLLTACVPSDRPDTTDHAILLGLDWIDRAIAATGGHSSGSGWIAFAASGTLDKTAEGQGLTPDKPSPGPVTEIVAVAPALGRAGREYLETRYDGTLEHVRELFPSDSERVWVIPPLALAVPLRSSEHRLLRRGLERRLPGLLLRELRERPAGIRWIGRTGNRHLVAGTLPGGTSVTIHFDADALPRRVEYLLAMPGRGDALIAWRFDDWRQVGEFRLPHRYGATIDGRAWLDLTVDSLVQAPQALFHVPDTFRTLPPRTVTADLPAPPPLEFIEVAPGVWVVPEVRGGFRPMVIALDSVLVAVDAPASYPLFGELPAGETDPGPGIGWVSERFVDAIRERFPDQRLGYVVLTHFHDDHAGGVRAFVEAGATVLAAPQAEAALTRLVRRPFRLSPDRLARSPAPLRFEPVETVRVLGGRIEIINVGDNPHQEGMLVVHLPEERILFVSDLLTPGRLETYPRPEHAALDRWFIRWLDGAGIKPERIYTMHGTGLATPEHLARLRAPAP